MILRPDVLISMDIVGCPNSAIAESWYPRGYVKSPLGTVVKWLGRPVVGRDVPMPLNGEMHRVGLHLVCRDPAVEPVIAAGVLGDSSRAAS